MRGETDRELHLAMLLLFGRGAIFLGQNVAYDGNVVYRHMSGIPDEQRCELPVCEELQMGIGIGLALQGFLPVLVYPRMDFLLRAMDQLVNHLDKMEAMSRGEWKPKVIIRTRVGKRSPLDAGPQHTQDHTEALKRMLANVAVLKIESADDIMPTYQAASRSERSVLVVEAL